MAKQPTNEDGSKQGIVARAKGFTQDVRTEMEKVTWPSQDDLKAFTQVVLLFLVILAVIVGSMDAVFQQVVLWLFRIA